MNAVGFLFSWHNLPFTLALATGMILALIQLFSSGDSESDGSAEGDSSLDGAGDSADDGGIHHADTHSLLAALGVGQIPLLIILMALLSSLGAVGLLSNAALTSLAGQYPDIAFVPVLLIAFLAALPLTRLISAGLARLAPRTSTAIQNEDLVGRSGTVVSATVSQTYGRVAVRDRHGTVHTIFAVVERGEPLPQDSEVAVLRYNEKQRQFVVRPLRSP